MRHAPAHMEFLMLNTGHVMHADRDDIDDAALAALAPVVNRGGQLPAPFAAFRVNVTHVHGGAVFTVWRGDEMLMTCGVAFTNDGAGEVWPALAGICAEITPDSAPREPEMLPWLSVVLLPRIVTTTQEEIARLGDFMPHFAFAIVASDAVE